MVMDLIVKKGTELFHSTGEPFDAEKLGAGFYDGLLWTTTDSAISQTYIPDAGSVLHTMTSHLLRPSKDPTTLAFQKELGLQYDDIEWNGNTAKSYRIKSTPFQDLEDLYYDKEKNISSMQIDKMRNQRVNDYITKKYGYKPEGGDDYNNNASWKFKMKGNQIMPADYQMKGRLFILVPTVDLKIYDMTQGGSVEGDLTDVDYHKLDIFEKAKRSGYDGVKINDYAQSKDLGNFGHHSIGIFPDSIKKLSKEVVNDVVHPELDKHYRDRDYRSAEYKKHRQLAEIRNIVRRTLEEGRKNL